MPKGILLFNAKTIDESIDVQFLFYCPGCKYHHSFRIKGDNPNYVWQWNNDFEKPTFSPSLLVNKDHPESRCHSFVREGKMQFLGDCFHNLKNTTIELPEID